MTSEEAVLACEDRLAQAMRAGDAASLDALLAADLVFIDQNGRSQGKAADMAIHRSGLLRLERLEISDRKVRLLGEDAALVTLRARLEGRYQGAHFSGHYAYSRVWLRRPATAGAAGMTEVGAAGTGWVVTAAHCSAVV